MKRGILFAVVFGILLLVVPTVVATETEIRIKTMPFYKVKVTILEHTENELEFKSLDYLSKVSDEYGDAIFDYDSSLDYFDLAVEIKRNDERVIFKKFRENYQAGKSVYLEVVVPGFEILKNPLELNISETEKPQEEVVEEVVQEAVQENSTSAEDKKTSDLTGATIGDGKSSSWIKVFYYIIVALFLSAAVFVAIEIKRKKLFKKPENKKQTYTDEDDDEDYNLLIADAEKKINEAQKEISELKKRNETEEKIRQMKKKLIQDQKDLVKLRESQRNQQD